MHYVYAALDYLWPLLLALSLFVGWILTVVTLPGNWLMVLTAALYAFFLPDSPLNVTWPWVVALAILATAGEVVELVAGAAGVKQLGGSRRGAILAMFGSVLGALVGGVLGAAIPVPVLGSVIGVFLGAGLGAMGGAMLGESWKGRTLDESFRVGQGAFWGRIAGSVVKVAIATVMVVVGLIAMPL